MCMCMWQDIHVVKRVIQALAVRSIVNLLGGLLHPLVDDVIVLGARPLDHLGIAQIHLGRVQAESVPATLGRRLHPQVADGLPVQLDGGEVDRRHLGVELGQLVEEGAVDQADAVEKLVVVGAGDCAGDEDIAVFLLVSGLFGL